MTGNDEEGLSMIPECSPFDLDMNISHTYELGMELYDEPQKPDQIGTKSIGDGCFMFIFQPSCR